MPEQTPPALPAAGGAPISVPAEPTRALIGTEEAILGGRPIGPTGGPGAGGAVIRPLGVPPAPTITTAAAAQLAAGTPVGGLGSTFNLEGAPIAILGGVFSNGLPIGGPVSQIFRGGSAPLPNTLFISTLTSAGPIGNFFIGSQGAPIGVDTFGGGALPISPPAIVAELIATIGPREALVGTPAITFEQDATLPRGGGPIVSG